MNIPEIVEALDKCNRELEYSKLRAIILSEYEFNEILNLTNKIIATLNKCEVNFEVTKWY